MSFNSVLSLILLGVSLVVAQRSPYAGSRPSSGYKDKFTNINAASTATATTTTAGGTQTNGVFDRFGETATAASTTVGPSTTTQRLPYDALGDSFAVQQAILKPQDHQPFWLINQAHIEAHRGGNTGRPQGVPASATTNGQDVVNRFGETDGSVVAGGVGPSGFDVSNINQISQQQIVYPVNGNVPNRNQGVSQLGSTQNVAQNLVPVQQPASPVQPLDQQLQLQQLQLELQQERQKQQLLQQLLLQQQALNSQQSNGQQLSGQQPIGQQPIGQQPIGQQPIGQEPIRQEPIRQELIRQEPIRPQSVQPVNTLNSNDQQFASSDNFYHIKPYFTEFDY